MEKKLGKAIFEKGKYYKYVSGNGTAVFNVVDVQHDNCYWIDIVSDDFKIPFKRFNAERFNREFEGSQEISYEEYAEAVAAIKGNND